MPFFEKGDVRIHYQEAGSGFPLMVIPGGGLNSTVAGLKTHPFNQFNEFANEFRVIAADLRNAKGGQSTGPLETGRAWDNASNALPSGGCRGPNDRLNCSGAKTDCAGVPHRTCTLLPRAFSVR